MGSQRPASGSLLARKPEKITKKGAPPISGRRLELTNKWVRVYPNAQAAALPSIGAVNKE